MINQAIQAIVSRMNAYIGTAEPDVILGNVSLLDAAQDGITKNLTDRVVASVVNIQQEGAMRNMPAKRTSTGSNGQPKASEQEPGIHLNVYLLFAANKNDYGIALVRIAQVISFFQRQHAFTPAEVPELGPLDLEKLVFELHSANFTELNQLWSILGGKYIPSVVYKMHLCIIQDAPETPAAMVEEIHLGVGYLTNR